MDMSKDLTLIELQRAWMDDPDNLKKKQEYLQQVATWSHLMDCLMEETPD